MVKYKYRFQIDIGFPLSIAVYAESYTKVIERCITVMDRRYEKVNQKPPLFYDMFLEDTNDPLHMSQGKPRYD